MPGSVAETVYGRQGGGWAAAPTSGVPKQQKRHVRVVGGPNSGTTWACYSWHRDPAGLEPNDKGGRFPELKPVVDWPAHGGRYVHDTNDDVYRWEPSQPEGPTS